MAIVLTRPIYSTTDLLDEKVIGSLGWGLKEDNTYIYSSTIWEKGMLISRGFYSFTVLTINRYGSDETNIHIGLPELLKILLAYKLAVKQIG